LDLSAGIESTLHVLSWKIPKGIEVVREYLSHDRIRADAGALNMVWANLIDNAVKAMGEKGRLVIRTERLPNGLEVSVSDTGSGIPFELRARLFEPFVSGRPAGAGTGLGLALCRRVVIQHGGRIDFESEPETGTTFRVLLPGLAQS
jgi:signal transduction histidine kinase